MKTVLLDIKLSAVADRHDWKHDGIVTASSAKCSNLVMNNVKQRENDNM